MCSIQDRLDLFLVPESRDTGLFCMQNRAYSNWMVNKCTRNSSLKMYFKGHAASNGLTAEQYTIHHCAHVLYVLIDALAWHEEQLYVCGWAGYEPGHGVHLLPPVL